MLTFTKWLHSRPLSIGLTDPRWWSNQWIAFITLVCNHHIVSGSIIADRTITKLFWSATVNSWMKYVQMDNYEWCWLTFNWFMYTDMTCRESNWKQILPKKLEKNHLFTVRTLALWYRASPVPKMVTNACILPFWFQHKAWLTAVSCSITLCRVVEWNKSILGCIQWPTVDH